MLWPGVANEQPKAASLEVGVGGEAYMGAAMMVLTAAASDLKSAAVGAVSCARNANTEKGQQKQGEQNRWTSKKTRKKSAQEGDSE